MTPGEKGTGASSQALRTALEHHQAGRAREAERAYREVLEVEPDNPDALHLLGVIEHQAGRNETAIALIERAIHGSPSNPSFLNNLGEANRGLRRLDAARACYEKALAIKPDYAGAYSNLGLVLHELGLLPEAEDRFRRALVLQPDLPEAHNNLGITLTELGRLHEAEESYRRALALKRDYAEAASNLGHVLQQLGRLEEATASYLHAIASKPEYPEAHSNLIFALDLVERCDAREQQAERRRWAERYARRHTEAAHPHANQRAPDRRLRIGYVSADFCVHSVYWIFSPILAAHDRAACEIVCYSGVKREDYATGILRRAADGWRSTLGMSDEDLAAQIRADAIDILVDLSGHSAGNRLLTFARKPAPVQVTGWGHATGTGLPAIDYLLADPVLVPAEDRALFAEKVIDLPCCVCYQPPDYLPAVTALPALGGGPFTFGCLNRLEKISDRTIGLWSRILTELPRARLLIKAPVLQGVAHRENYSVRLEAAGIDSRRVDFLGTSPHGEHLAAYARVDLALDPYPHGGGVSTLEALWMGVPVLTLKGSTAPGRLSASILSALGMREWIAESDDEYVRIAVEAARSLQRMEGVRQGLRARAAGSPVGDVRSYVRDVEAAYRAVWRRWCNA